VREPTLAAANLQTPGFVSFKEMENLSVSGARSFVLFIVTLGALAGCGVSQSSVVLPRITLTRTEARSGSASMWPLKRLLASPGYKATSPLVYVTNYNSNTVTVYPAKAKDPAPLATISSGISSPGGACIDAHGTLYVTNQPSDGGGWISEYRLGKDLPSKIIKHGANTPASCAIDAQGDLWVTNLGGPDVTEYLYGSKKPHTDITKGLTFPVGVAIDHFGNLYVANGWGASQQNVQVYAPGNKSPSRTITDGVTWPGGITVDSNATLYVANVEQNNVEEYRSGQEHPFQTITEAMNLPAAPTVSREGRLYVTNYGNNVVVEFPTGSLTPSKREISKGLYTPEGIAYYPPLVP
jgi:hypothetical protein